MAVTFPTLSQGVISSSFKETKAYDPSIRSQAEDSTIISRARFTANKYKWEFSYANLTDVDRGLLDTLQDDTMVGAELITWTHPKTDVVYTVRLGEPIRLEIMDVDIPLWRAHLILIED